MDIAIPVERSVVYIRYLDHVLYRNITEPMIEPIERETVGWLTHQNKEVVHLELDRNFDELQCSSGHGSGLVILRNCIIEIRVLPLKNFSSMILFSRNNNSGSVESALSDKEAKNSA